MNKKYCVDDERAHQSSKVRTLTYVQDIGEMLPEMNAEVSKVGALAELIENNKGMSETLREGLANMLADIHSVYTRWAEDVGLVVGYAARYVVQAERDDGMKEVTLTISPEHYQIIEKMAEIQETSVESLLLDTAKCSLSGLLPEKDENWEDVKRTNFDIHPWLKETESASLPSHN